MVSNWVCEAGKSDADVSTVLCFQGGRGSTVNDMGGPRRRMGIISMQSEDDLTYGLRAPGGLIIQSADERNDIDEILMVVRFLRSRESRHVTPTSATMRCK